MEKILEDAFLVKKYLPWISTNEEIVNYMRTIPLDQTYQRIAITLKHFLSMRDLHVTEQQIEDETREIITILPKVPYLKLKNGLKLLGATPNRKEVICRLFLNSDNIEPEVNAENRKINFQNWRSDFHITPLHKKPEICIGNSKATPPLKEELNPNACISEMVDGNPLKLKISRPQSKTSSDKINTAEPIFLEPTTSVVANVASTSQDFFPIIKPATLKVAAVDLSMPVRSSPIQNNALLGAASSVTATSTEIVPLLAPVSSKVPVGDFNVPSTSPSIPHQIPALPQHFLNRYPRKQKLSSNATITEDLTLGSSHKSDINVFIDLMSNFPKEQSAGEKVRNCDDKLVFRLIEMFPDTCSEYIRDICHNKHWEDFDDVVTIILDNENHPKRQRRSPSPHNEVDPDEQFEIVKALLPDADPTYLRMQCEMLEYKPKELNKFVIQARERKDYPTMKEYLRKQQLSAQSKQYTTEFDIKKFVELFPEPAKTFSDPTRVLELDSYSKMYIKYYFENKFVKLSKKTISATLIEFNYKISQTFEVLSSWKEKMKSRRKPVSLNTNVGNILILQEIAYVEHKEEIENYLKGKQKEDEEERRIAKENGLMNTCQCCFDDELMQKDTFFCPAECLFCRSCIKKSCEIAFGEGRNTFNCLNNCPEEFPLQTLQSILSPKMFTKITQKKTYEEIKAAGIEDLETCPFCDFASIPNEQDKIFKCLNPDCMKESCRNCKEPNHIPLRCDEIEKDENVKARVYIENKMTEALLCKCWKCGTSFFKEEGCNKMTCTCGAHMCYVCKKPVEDYKHFNGMGGDKFHLCPLYSDNNNLNKQKVLKAVTEAKTQIDQSKLKSDPETNVQQYYDDRARQLPREPHLQALRNAGHIILARHGPPH